VPAGLGGPISKDLRAAVEVLADRWDGYGHGRFNVHLEENLPCSACDLLGALRAMLVEEKGAS